MVRYLITSGNSKTGKATIQALKALGENDIVAGARDPVKSEKDLKSAGASVVVELDLTKPDTIAKAFAGVDRVLLVHGADGATDNSKLAQNAVDAATAPGATVKVIGKVAGYASDVNSPSPYAQIHGRVFEILKKSGLQYFAVGPSFFFENWFQNKDAIRAGSVPGASGGAKVPYIAVSDIGAAAAVALKNPEKYNGRHLQITGPGVKEADIVKEISAATGLPITYNDLPSADYEALLKKYGLPDQLVNFLGTMEKVKASGLGETVTVDFLKELIGRDPIDAHAWAHANAAAFK